MGDMLGGDIGFGAMGGHTDRAHPGVIGGLKIVNGADPRHQKCCQFGGFKLVGDGGDPFQIGVPAKTIGKARPGQPVAVAEFDRGHTGAVQRRGNVDALIQSVPVADRVHPVAQGHILHVELGLVRVGHLTRPPSVSAAPAVRRFSTQQRS